MITAKSAHRAANLTRQLLISGREQEMRRQPVKLNEVIGSFIEMVKRIIGVGIQLQCACAPALPFVSADIGMIEQVLMNLEYSPHPEVILRLHQIQRLQAVGSRLAPQTAPPQPVGGTESLRGRVSPHRKGSIHGVGFLNLIMKTLHGRGAQNLPLFQGLAWRHFRQALGGLTLLAYEK